MAAKVKSLKALQALVQGSGGAEGVEVEVEGPLEKLGDAPAIFKLLIKMEKTNRWTVIGVDKLKPLIPVAATVQKASQTICELIPNYDPDIDKIVLNLSVHAREMRRLANKLERLANKLERLGKRLVGLRNDTKLLADDLQELVKRLKVGATKHHPTYLHYLLCERRKSCAEVYNMVITLDADDN